MEPVKTVICVDTSGSTYGQSSYYKKVNALLQDAFKVISWNSEAKEISSRVLDGNDAKGGTYPHTFLEIIKTYDFKYRLIVTTDGEVCDSYIKQCETILAESNILDDIVDFSIYYIGNECDMNMKLDNLFSSPNFRKEIFINNHPKCSVDINIDFDNLTLSDVIDNNNLKASIISLISASSRNPEMKSELRTKVCQLSNRLLSEMADENGLIKEFFENNDIPGCINFIRSHLATGNKKQLQQRISDILNLFNEGADIYTLSHLSNANTIQAVEVMVDSELEEDENEEDDDKLICDIMLIKCKHICLLIRQTEESIIPDEISKQISIHPFLLLKHEDLIKKAVNLVEYQQIDLWSYMKLEDQTISPFTRLPLKGVYIFNSDSDDINYGIVRKNNNRMLSVIFGDNDKLPGNKGIWNVLFLYILMKHHPKWKEESELMKKEIKYVSENTQSFLTLSPLLDPNIKDRLDVCLWYIVNVSHKMFPNSSKNILREMGESSEFFLDFYSEVFNTVDRDVYDRNRAWLVWNYLVQQKSNKRKLRCELLAQYQNYVETKGTLLFFSGKCDTRYESPLNILPVEKVLALTKMLNKSSSKFDNIDQAGNEPPNVAFIDCDCSEHVLICLNTCQPTLICPLTKKYWKDCAGTYSVENASYFRAFKDYCFEKKKYPTSVCDLITYHSDRHYRRFSDFIIYPSDTMKRFEIVLKKFKLVVETHSIEECLRVSNKNNCEAARQEYEKLCKYELCEH